MKKILAFLLLFNILAFCDNNSTEEMNFFLQFVKRKISINKFYPDEAWKKRIEGEVFLEFTIEKNGKLKNVRTKYKHKVLEEASLATLKQSFPIYVSTNIKDQLPKRVGITLRYFLENDKILIP